MMTLMNYLKENDLISDSTANKYDYIKSNGKETIQNLLVLYFGSREMYTHDVAFNTLAVDTFLQSQDYRYKTLYNTTVLQFDPLDRYNIIQTHKETNTNRIDENVKNTGSNRQSGSDNVENIVENVETKSGESNTSANKEALKTMGGSDVEQIASVEKLSGESDTNTSQNIDNNKNTSNSKRTYDSNIFTDLDRIMDDTTIVDTSTAHSENSSETNVDNEKTIEYGRTDTENTTEGNETKYDETLNRDETQKQITTYGAKNDIDETTEKNVDETNDKDVIITNKGLNNIDYEGIIQEQRKIAQISLFQTIAEELANTLTLMMYNFEQCEGWVY